MPQVTEVQIGLSHAFSVVGNLYFFLAALFYRNLDTGGSGINGVFNQLLYGRGGAFNNLSCSNFIDDFI